MEGAGAYGEERGAGEGAAAAAGGGAVVAGGK
jgi:hypothetical protein